MADLTQQTIDQDGLEVTYDAAAAGGDTVPTRNNAFLHVKNGGGGSINVTIDAVKQCDQGFDHDLVVAVPAGEERMIGPLTAARFGALAAVSYSAVTSVTVAALAV